MFLSIYLSFFPSFFSIFLSVFPPRLLTSVASPFLLSPFVSLLFFIFTLVGMTLLVGASFYRLTKWRPFFGCYSCIFTTSLKILLYTPNSLSYNFSLFISILPSPLFQFLFLCSTICLETKIHFNLLLLTPVISESAFRILWFYIAYTVYLPIMSYYILSLYDSILFSAGN